MSLCVLVVINLQLLLRCYGQKRLRVGGLHNSEEEASSLQPITGDSSQWRNHHTSGVRTDGAETLNAGQGR